MTNLELKVGYWVRLCGRWYEVHGFDEDKGTSLGYGLWVCATEFDDIRRTKPKPFACPVCGAKVKVARKDDGETFYEIDDFTGDLTEIDAWSNGHTTIHCSTDSSHELGYDIEDNVYAQI